MDLFWSPSWFFNFTIKTKDGCNVSQLVVAYLFCELQWLINDIYAYVYIYFQMPILNIICWRPFWKLPWWGTRNSTECTTFSVMILGIERHLLLLSQLEMNEKTFFTYTLIYMCNDDNDMKKIFFFQFSRCGYIRLLSALIPDGIYVIFLLVNRKCKMLRLL